MTRRAQRPGAWLYRLHTADGTLAFVGATTRLVSDRLREHRHRSKWWPQVNPDLTTAVAYVSEAEAREALQEALKVEQPLFNVQHVPATITYTTANSRASQSAGASGYAMPPQPYNKAVGNNPADRVARRIAIDERAKAQRPPDPRQPGGFLPGDVVSWLAPMTTEPMTLTVATVDGSPQDALGQLVYAFDPDGSSWEPPGAELTLITASDGTQPSIPDLDDDPDGIWDTDDGDGETAADD